MLPSGHSFLVGVYKTTEDRDEAVTALKQECVTYKEKKEPLMVAPFSQKTTGTDGLIVWYIKMSLFVTLFCVSMDIWCVACKRAICKLFTVGST